MIIGSFANLRYSANAIGRANSKVKSCNACRNFGTLFPGFTWSHIPVSSAIALAYDMQEAHTRSAFSLRKESDSIMHKYRKIVCACQTMGIAWVSVIVLQELDRKSQRCEDGSIIRRKRKDK